MLDRHHTVAHVVLDHSECAEVFQRHRIDFCCRGELTLEEAAQGKQLDVEALVAELSRAIESRRGERSPDPRALTTPQLIEHILAHHDDSLRRALPFVRALAAKVARVHGEHNPKLRDLQTAVDELEAMLAPHLEEEARAVFPLLAGQAPDGAVVARQLGAMQEEHRALAELFERVRLASDGFSLPPWACTSYRTLFSELEQLEAQTFTRVHLEHHVLTPRFAVA